MAASTQMVQLAIAVSWLCGWLYFLAWSISFYPQILLNLRRRTTKGVLPDFPLLNIVGFSCYTLSSAVFLYSPIVREQYAARHPLSPTPTVRFNDLVFGVHALVMSLVVYSQFWPRLWGWKELDGVRRNANKISLGLIWGGILGIAITVVLVLPSENTRGTSNAGPWAWLDVIYATGYVKLILTVFKYIPQMVANFRRRSTIGWSIWQQLLDLSGGLLSLLQLVIDSALQADWSGLTGNPIKLGLSNISILFDVVFILQHYVLFGPVAAGAEPEESIADPARGPRREEVEPLLPATRDS